MEEGFCNSCSRVTGYKREIGIGTLFAVFLTFGFWLLLIPLYPKRCKICGNQKTIERTEEEISVMIKNGVSNCNPLLVQPCSLNHKLMI